VSIGAGWTAQSAADFDAFMAESSNWGRWGADDDLGTVNLLTAERAAAAAAHVRYGRTVSLTRQITTGPAVDNPQPMLHLMKASGEGAAEIAGSHASDWIGLAYHGFAVTHIDAHSHQFWNGRYYNDRPATDVATRTGAAGGSVEPLARGLVGRGVLLDAPRALGRSWLEPGEGIGPDDLDRIAATAGVEVGPGDIVLVRTGRDPRAAARGVTDPIRDGSAGLTQHCLPWLREHDVAILGTDVQADVMEPGGAPYPMPVHAGALAFLGLPLIDNLLLEDLAQVCAELDRWHFLLTVAPLALRRATGSPVNPIALL
jgi:kynurenine formamidase